MSLCYATIQRKILPQLAGLMTLEKQGSLTIGQLMISLDFDWDTVQDAVREIARNHSFEHNGMAIWIGPVKVEFCPTLLLED